MFLAMALDTYRIKDGEGSTIDYFLATPDVARAFGRPVADTNADVSPHHPVSATADLAEELSIVSTSEHQSRSTRYINSRLSARATGYTGNSGG